MPLLITRSPARWSLDTLSPDDRALVLGALEHIAGLLEEDHSIHSQCLEGDRGLLRGPKPGVIGPVYEWGFDSWADAKGLWEAAKIPG